MHFINYRHAPTAFVFLLIFISAEKSFSQAELQAWGNLTGIRVQGELMGFETSIRVVGDQWSSITATGKEQQRPAFSRNGDNQIVNTQIGNIFFTETVTDTGAGKANIAILSRSAVDTAITGSFFCISLSAKDYERGTIQFDNEKAIQIATRKADSVGSLMKISASRLKIKTANREIVIQTAEKGMIFLRNETKNKETGFGIYFPLQTGSLHAGDKEEKIFTITAAGIIDKKDILLTLDPIHPGRSFAGLGGNFRIQNLKADPGVIDYCLKNLRVAWGRVEMPWRFWQPEKNMDPVAQARDGKTDAHVLRAMEMAQKLQRLNIPVILTDWSAPDWAIIGKPVFSPRKDGVWGNPLNPDSASAIYKSIADYIQYLNDQYDVQVKWFSFNESDLGIYVRQTGVQHADLIKGLGEYFLERGLKTKMLLGDNSDATTYSFIDPALHDTTTHPYIGAVSFHSWRGWDTETLMHWTDASHQINLPLIVGEGSIDAAAWAYPAIFLEQTYAMEEINLYIRLMAICQPLSILQWQLTSDYSPLTGGGISGKDGPLEPTQRFWNLRQLASTPEGLHYLPVKNNSTTVSCAALGNQQSGKYLLHIVNNGAARKVVLSGIPAGIRLFKIVSTGKNRSMQEGMHVNITKGKTEFVLPAGCFTTLSSEQ